MQEKKGVGVNRSSGEEAESAKLMAMKDNCNASQRR